MYQISVATSQKLLGNETGVLSMVYLVVVEVFIRNFQIIIFNGFNYEIDTQQDVNAFAKK